jgi:hypothetical protein
LRFEKVIKRKEIIEKEKIMKRRRITGWGGPY